MPAVLYHLKAEFEDGLELTVVADQRDVAAWEQQPFGTSGLELSARAYSAFRFMAFNAMRRQGLVDASMTWKGFSATCVQVMIDDDAEAAGAVDPGRPVRPEDSSST